MNGDGFDELIIGAYRADSTNNTNVDAGESYLIFGKADWSGTTSIDLATLGATGVVIYGVDADDYSGWSVSSAGDVNGDGFDDLVIGAHQADGPTNNRLYGGESHLIFGKADWSTTSTIEIGNLGTAGVTIFGISADDKSGFSVSNAGDVNADGFDDVLIGAIGGDGSTNNKAEAGESYVIFGKTNWASTPTINLSSLGNAGITIFGAETGDLSGISVRAAGDVDGDGFDDLLVGAAFAAASGNSKTDAGESYLIYGDDSFTSSVTHLGTAADNTLTGTTGANIMVGGRGDDIVLGQGGADVLTGGQGNDILAVSNLAFKKTVGGTGNDTLRLDGSSLTLNLTTLRDNRLLGVETIDITGSGNNTLILSYRDVLNLSDESNALVVRRNFGDVVDIGSGWNQGSNELIDGNYFDVYTQGQATLKVQEAFATILNRQLFYNRSTSSVFGDGTGNPQNAIASNKSALLPGQTASISNYTNFSRGLNGIVIDIANLAGTLSVADFQFATWNGIRSGGFAASTAARIITVIQDGGTSGTNRIKIEFADNAIRNTWLRVTMLSNANTGLETNDVFYFGNAVGDMNAGNTGSPTFVRTDESDATAVRQNQSATANSVGVANLFDLNKDGRVNAIDLSLVRQNIRSYAIRLFTAPTNLRRSSTPTTAIFGPSVPWLESKEKKPVDSYRNLNVNLQ